jgi:hypothetical protein
MRRLLQFRMLVVLVALALIPAATLPFAERLREEWTRFWEPKAKPVEPTATLMVVDGFGSATPLLSSADGVGPVRIEFVEGLDVIILSGPREDLQTDSGTADDYAKAFADPNASDDERRRAFFEAIRARQDRSFPSGDVPTRFPGSDGP